MEQVERLLQSARQRRTLDAVEKDEKNKIKNHESMTSNDSNVQRNVTRVDQHCER